MSSRRTIRAVSKSITGTIGREVLAGIFAAHGEPCGPSGVPFTVVRTVKRKLSSAVRCLQNNRMGLHETPFIGPHLHQQILAGTRVLRITSTCGATLSVEMNEIPFVVLCLQERMDWILQSAPSTFPLQRTTPVEYLREEILDEK